MDRFEKFKLRLGIAESARRAAEKRSAQSSAREARRNRHLSAIEAETFARRIHEMLKELEPELRRQGINKTQLCQAAFGRDQSSSRELYRVALPTGADKHTRGLRMHLDPYRSVAAALEQLTNRRSGQLVRRLVEGTPCDHLRNADDRWSDIDRLVAAVDVLVTQLEAEFRWTETYRRTFELRRAGIQRGERLCWPLWDINPTHLLDDGPSASEEYQRILDQAADPTTAFYVQRPDYLGYAPRGTAHQYADMGALQDAEFFYVPHAPIGHVSLWDVPPRHANAAEHEKSRLAEIRNHREHPKMLQLPVDGWNASERRPVGQLDPMSCTTLQYHLWLVVYPSPTLRSGGSFQVVAALYQAGEEGGAWIMPLTSDNLAAVADAVWLDESRDSTLLDRLTELVVMDETEEASIAASLRRTGDWLQHNPVLKAEEQRIHRQQQLLRIANRASRK